MGGSTAGVSASSQNQSGTKTDTIDAETKAFRDNLFGVYNNFTKNIKGFGGDDTATFIAPESQDTKSYYDAIRGMQGGVNPNSAGINTFGRGLMANGGVTGGNAYQNAVTGQSITGGDVGYNAITAGNIQAQTLDPAYNTYFGGYNAAFRVLKPPFKWVDAFL